MAKLLSSGSGSISIVTSLSLASRMDEGRLGRLWRPTTVWWCADDVDDDGDGEGREVERSALEGLRGSGGGTARRRRWMRYRVLRCAFSSTLADTLGMRAISVEWSAALVLVLVLVLMLSSMVELRRRRRVGRVLLLCRRGLDEVPVVLVLVLVLVPQGSSGGMAPGKVPARNEPGVSQMAREGPGWFRW